MKDLIRYNGHEILMYVSIQDLPIDRFQLYNRAVLMDAGIGSDLNDFDTRINDLDKLIQHAPNKARIELRNHQQLVHFVISNTSPRLNAFIALIKKIDGKELTDEDMTDEGLKRVVDRLAKTRLSIGLVQEFLDNVKKNFENEFEVFFPQKGVSSSASMQYALLRRKLICSCQKMQGQDVSEQEKQIESDVVGIMEPKVFAGPNGIEVKDVKNFEDAVIYMKQHNVATEPRKMTVLAFFRAAENIEKQAKKTKKRA